jgi:hypothetical protein
MVYPAKKKRQNYFFQETLDTTMITVINNKALVFVPRDSGGASLPCRRASTA